MEISARAMTVSCPSCHKKLLVEDITVSNAQSVTKLQTCGKLTVEKGGRVIAQLVEAAEGIEVHGILETKAAVTLGKVFIGSKAQWKGDCKAPTLEVELGARITRGFFEIKPEAVAQSNPSS